MARIDDRERSARGGEPYISNLPLRHAPSTVNAILERVGALA
jgi:hypothetical protein